MKRKNQKNKIVYFYIILIIFTGFIGGENIILEDNTKDNTRVYDQWTWTDAQIRSVFSHISKVSGIDFVLDPSVSGDVTLSVTRKTWKEVTQIVCRMKQLIMIEEEGYNYITSEGEYIKQIQNKEVSNQGLSEVIGLEREIVKLSNTSVAELEGPIKDLLSKRGKITIVKHNNSLIIYDTRDNITQIKDLINQLDVEVYQISISAKILEVSSGEINNLGIQWSFFDDRITHLPTPVKGENIISGALERASYGIIGSKNYSIAMEYLFSESRSNVVAQPQIVTMDNKKAHIFMGSQIPITYLDEGGNTTIKMIDAGTELFVTPHVTGDERIILELNPAKKSYELTREGLPVINEQSAKTNVVVDDGETVVIAGLTSNEDHNSEGGIPILKDIPLLGHFFKRSSKIKDKKDLIIFVTPHIIKRDMSPVFTKYKEEVENNDSIQIPAEN
jgi:type IV pilus assembly protein PilQ